MTAMLSRSQLPSGLVVWTAFAAAVTGLSTLFMVLLVGTTETPWNFPGEPPAFDASLIPVIPSFLLSVPLGLWVGARWRKVQRIVAVLAVASAVVSSLSLSICLAGILERHGDRWSGVRNAIRSYGDAIAAELGGRDKVARDAEFVRLREKYFPSPVWVELPGYGLVQLRMTYSVYPYVGVDFGCCGHAIFEPQTMLVKYSD